MRLQSRPIIFRMNDLEMVACRDVVLFYGWNAVINRRRLKDLYNFIHLSKRNK